MKVIVAKSAGFCFGVQRAVSICERAAAEHGDCVTLGPIIHNESVVKMLEDKGVRAVSDISEVKPGQTVIIRSHGIGRHELELLRESGARIIDATCPDVKRIHEIVAAESEAGRLPVIIGERGHPEVTAIAGWCDSCEVLATPDELADWLSVPENRGKPVSMVFQTTETGAVFEMCGEIIKKECTNHKVFDTICNATYKRQREAAELSSVVDAMVVVGDKSSRNSVRLAEICAMNCNVLFALNAEELDLQALRGVKAVGITAGASTPAWIIKEVNQKMSEEIILSELGEETKAPVADETEAQAEPEASVPEAADISAPDVVDDAAPEAAGTDDDGTAEDSAPVAETFEEMLERSIKTLHTGEKVTGVIAAITATEVSVDLGTKQSGYIPISEFTDDSSVKIEDVVKIGDSIETFVMRVNDVEGTVMLSKKRLDAIRNWDAIDAAAESRAVVEGVVTEENKGGVVVSVKGVRVFVPASQTGLMRDAPMTELVGKRVRLRVTEVNQSRRRVVGSIRSVSVEERREKSDKLWTEIEVGKRYTGVVKSMTSYGVFVDIGGVDGMIHISELSWTRIKQPSDVMSVGDTVEVYVLSFDKDKKKISLGYKNNEDNPWTKFTTNYKVGDVISVKIVKMMPFGAFAEILPGVDGLIHISQITDHRIGLPSEVLSDGQQVDVKITEIDNDRKKISLSIRALLAPDTMPLSDADVARATDTSPVVVYDTDSPPPAEESEAAEDAE